MSDDEPKRWRDDDEAPARVRDVLRRGADVPRMPDAVRAAVLGALLSPGGGGAGGEGGPTAPPAPSAAPAPGGLSLSAGTLGAGTFAIVAVGAALAWLASSASPPATTPSAADSRSRPAAVVAAPPVPSPPPPASSPAPPAPAAPPPTVAPSSAPRARALEAAPVASSALSATAPSADTLAADTLAAESDLISRARASLASSPSATLSAVDEHAARFPRGELALERDYLRIRALRGLGRAAEARAHATSYLVTYPKSPQAAAVRAFVETPEASAP